MFEFLGYFFFHFCTPELIVAFILLATGSVMSLLTALVSNTIVIIALWRSKSMNSATKALFYGLAFSDLATVLTQPLFVFLYVGCCLGQRITLLYRSFAVQSDGSFLYYGVCMEAEHYRCG